MIFLTIDHSLITPASMSGCNTASVVMDSHSLGTSPIGHVLQNTATIKMPKTEFFHWSLDENCRGLPSTHTTHARVHLNSTFLSPRFPLLRLILGNGNKNSVPAVQTKSQLKFPEMRMQPCRIGNSGLAGGSCLVLPLNKHLSLGG